MVPFPDPHLPNDPPPEIKSLIEDIRRSMRHMSPSDLGMVDQLKAQCVEHAREVLAYYMVGGLHSERNQAKLEEDAAIKMILALQPLGPDQLVGVVLALTEIIAKFLLAQGDGTYAAAFKRILDPKQPLVPGLPDPNEDPLWRLEQEGL